MRKVLCSLAALCCAAALGSSARAQVFTFSTGTVNNLIGTASRPGSAGNIEIESADDFITTAPITLISGGSFTGIIPTTTTISSVTVEIYRVFPKDSGPFDGMVPTRNNSPSDVEFDDRTSTAGNLTFTTKQLSANFATLNSVLNGINKSPNQTTGGEGPVRGQEVEFDLNFTTPFALGADHYFFIPQVQLSNGDFFWLSASRPIDGTGTPFAPDLQSWIRNANLDPDWLRVGTDIVGGATPPTFNAAFSLSGQAVPEPGAVAMFGAMFVGGAAFMMKRRKK